MLHSRDLSIQNDEDAAFLTTLGATHRVSPSLFDDFVETRYTQSGAVELPLAGTVQLWAFQNTPFPLGEDLIGPMKEGVRNIEGYMGVPFPADRVIMVSVVRPPDSHYDIAAGQHGSGHIHVVRAESGPLRQRVLYHELAHYYYNFFPIWLLEGGAEFMSSVVQDRTQVMALADRAPVVEARLDPNCYSEGYTDLNELNEGQGFYIPDNLEACNYIFGEHFLIRVTGLLGTDAVSSALRNLYLLINSDERDFPLTGKDFFLAFLENTPAGLVEGFRGLFRTVHGGPWADAVTDVPDDHGNDATSASELPTGQAIQGSMDHEFDVDTFAFEVEEGSGYRIIFWEGQEVDVDVDERLDFHLTLRSADGGPRESLRYQESRVGLEADWIAPRSGRHVIAVESAAGKRGMYSLEIHHLVIGEDDHADHPEDATLILAGESVSGAISYGADADYFETQVDPGNGYTVQVLNHTLGSSQVRVYAPDGSTEVERISSRSGRHGSEMLWMSPISGTTYLSVESPHGLTGTYTLKITEVVPGNDDHGDAAPNATNINLGDVVEGTIDTIIDRDYFRFPAAAGSAYNIRFWHLTIHHQPVKVYDLDGVTVLHEFWPYSPESRGSHIPWEASRTGDFYVEMWSPDGDTGDYTLLISYARADGDDHGDSSLSASVLRTGEVVDGALDSFDDFDFLRFQAESGSQYLIEATFEGVEDPRLSLYARDGVTAEFRFVDSGHYFRYWVAPQSGNYYVALWSATGGTGGYEVSVSIVVN